MKKFHLETKAALLASTLILPAQVVVAQDSDIALDEIVVTAQKRTQNLQDVPVSVQVLGNTQMENLNVNGFGDYIKMLPTVSYETSRPGVAQIYMRGIVSGGDGNHSGAMPSVGVYLDEQPITTINEILDMHMYDISRVESLAGPQGTLFGASSQAGTLRIITNKPVMNEFEAGYDVTLNTVKSGEMGYSLEGFVNIPVSENAAIRLVGWHKEDGGYIDNVPGTLEFFNGNGPEGGNEIRDNAALVEENFNDVTTTGARALLKIDLNENWTVTPGLVYQKMKSTGLFDHDPDDVGDLQVTTYADALYDEEWYQGSLTVEGNIAGLDVVYAGAYLNRDRLSEYDYTGFTQYYVNYYNAAYGGEYCWYYQTDDSCAELHQYTTGDETFKRSSHELRFQTPSENRLRFIGGAFYQKSTHDFDLRWIVPGATPEGAFGDVVPEDPETVVWQTYQIREDRETAFFGELAFDISEKLTMTAGVRAYKYDNTLYGFNGYLAHCTYYLIEEGDDAGRPDYDRPRLESGEPDYPCFDTRVLDGISKGNGTLFKVNLEYTIDDDKMVYATFSEGYRPGGVNRARIPGTPGYEPDFVTNYEFGWKTKWLDGRLRFNGSLYHLKWDDIQLGILDFDVSILTIIRNAGKSTTTGFDFDLDYAASENLILSLSGSYNDAKLKTDFISNGNLLAPSGTTMPYVPKVQLSGSARYTYEVANLPGFAQVSVVHKGGSWSALDTRSEEQFVRANGAWGTRDVGRRGWQNSYTAVGISAGIDGDNWSLGFFVDNLFDTRPVTSNGDFVYTAYYSAVDSRSQTIKPRNMSIRFGQKF